MVKLPFSLKEIKPGEFTYFTKRKLQNKEGEETGEIFVWKRRGDLEHSFAMECPYCNKDGEGTVDLKKRPYRVRCPNCNRSIMLKKLKDT
jgi:transcription elongation factor Elf1